MASEGGSARRVDIGFSGGQVLSLRMRDDAFGELRSALDSGQLEGWHEIATEDSKVTVDLAQVVYVRLETERDRVGF